MAYIDIRRNHRLSHGQAREAAEEIARQLNEEFSLLYEWDGNTLYFERSGINGQLEIEEEQVVVTARLGLLLTPLRGHFENEIQRYLDELFGHA